MTTPTKEAGAFDPKIREKIAKMNGYDTPENRELAELMRDDSEYAHWKRQTLPPPVATMRATTLWLRERCDMFKAFRSVAELEEEREAGEAEAAEIDRQIEALQRKREAARGRAGQAEEEMLRRRDLIQQVQRRCLTDPVPALATIEERREVGLF